MKNKGISLIVLIITIVVIIILAAAVILTITKNNPVESAKKATFVNDLSAYQDELSMYIGNKYIETKGDFKLTELDNKALEEVISVSEKYKEKFTIKDGRIIGTDKLTEQEQEWAKSITNGETGSVTPPETSNYTDTDGKKAYIPTGFKVSSVEDEQKIDTGLVIKDDKGNEFVWIPVEYTDEADFNTKFIHKEGYSNSNIQTHLQYCSEPLNIQNEKDEYNAMVESVKKYHGYYIARYEASDDGNGNMQSKGNVAPLTGIKWANSITDLSGGGVEKARAMYPVSSATNGSAVSTLCYGVEWDVALDFIENYGIKDKNYRVSSSGKGNYGSTKINTGSNKSYSLNNIYDMAGNVWDVTMEIYSNTSVVCRGGHYAYAREYASSGRNYSKPDTVMDRFGYRVALYIK